MKKWILVVWACLCVVNLMAQAPIKTLLITGQNNHNWQVSHVVLKRILENSGRFTVDYGKARIFHTMLGHAGESVEHSPAMQCTGFQVTLLRGAEWAATGEVTQPVPADFPTAQKATFRMEYKVP